MRDSWVKKWQSAKVPLETSRSANQRGCASSGPAQNEGGRAGLFRRVSSRPAYRRPLPPGGGNAPDGIEHLRPASGQHGGPKRPSGRRYWRGSLSASKNGKRMAGPADRALFPMVSRKETGQRLSLFHLSNVSERTAGSRRHIPGCRSIRRYRPSSTDYQECWCGVRCWT